MGFWMRVERHRGRIRPNVAAPPPGGQPGLLSPGIRAMVAGVFYFSVMSLAVKLVGARVPSQQVVLTRGVLNAVFSYGLVRRAGVRPWGERPLALSLRGLFGFLSLSCQYWAVVRLPLADATLLQYTNPVWTALLAVWVLGERMRAREAVAVALSLGGVVLIARPSFLFGHGAGLEPLAVGVALAGALFSASAYVTVRKLGRTEHPLVIVLYFTLVTVPASVPGVIAAGAVLPTAREWGYLLLVGITAQLGQLYLTRGLQLEPAGRATAVGYLQTVFAAAWGAIFFAELPGRWSILGAVVVLAGTLALATAGRRPARTPRVADDSAAEIPVALDEGA
jgi:drug/metabolite transporter (DMT)-like permease